MNRGELAGLQLAEPGLRSWRQNVRAAVRDNLEDFVHGECVRRLDRAGVGVAGDLLAGFLDGGKYVRSTFMYLGWLCGADEDDAALRASASLELLHTFALIQDDVMDNSPLRRARPTAHVVFGRWHRDNGLAGSASRFGESAAILLGDLCLVWAEEMLRRSGIGADALARVLPRYDDMRTELAVGQLSDLLNSCQTFPTLPEVLDVLRRKSGNYTVRRPLELGAAMAGCGNDVSDALSGYGAAIGEAFQLRDDILGVFGSPSLTGKSVRSDMEEGKATSVIVAAYELAGAGLRRQLAELMRSPEVDADAVERWRTLIMASGAVQWIEEQIARRHDAALRFLDGARLPEVPRAALAEMAVACTQRAA
ncbi:polyprenyl synthetase family protein [Mycobacterium sp. ITM-2016-00317]|uniref:polyprenyl synthetase family protein n=1 Tax=Mycobacterium sp. ITM-2016-00317 TaxID=2099694 RepID=UPI000D46BDBA|nr:polyprenyl synthetase family protein [Mycobacterium sp. ITM-2016-00317]WNG88864.1 polyprenyl synthetase family protein [Mycobacterium sp. ITM-2016-00317]